MPRRLYPLTAFTREMAAAALRPAEYAFSGGSSVTIVAAIYREWANFIDDWRRERHHHFCRIGAGLRESVSVGCDCSGRHAGQQRARGDYGSGAD